jgi:hypothetical protein
MKRTPTLMMLCFIASLGSSSCAKIYYGSNADNVVGSYKSIAIIPPDVTIQARKKVDAEALRNNEKTTSGLVQAEMYSWLLRRNAQGRFRPQPQDIDNTTVLLERAGYSEQPLTSQELCSLLGVDGLVFSDYSLDKPMSEGGAIALAVFTGAYGSTNKVFVDYRIKDCATDQLMFSYNHKLSGSIGSSPENIVDGLMRRISKKMPGYNSQ